MLNIRKVMVPTAFYTHAGELIRYAAGLAKAFQAELMVVNIINVRDIETLQRASSYGTIISDEQYVKLTEDERRQEIANLLEGVDFPADKVRIIFRIGHPADALMQLAVEENVDMIVMGIRDRSDFMHTFTGSVADRLFRRSPVTIVSFRDEKNAEHLRKRLKL
ncbi:MAG: universal stress protein [Desulfobulbaceae bacterium]|jgi:nucleotide-binding universal stress UspA family protein|nr:universal stress protein [Desulfobulbaceae bacterium]MDY0350489.1 universal stress protein [Desulfobulbaceae bacterium]